MAETEVARVAEQSLAPPSRCRPPPSRRGAAAQEIFARRRARRAPPGPRAPGRRIQGRVGDSWVETVSREVYGPLFVANATSRGGHAWRKESGTFRTRDIPLAVAAAATILASQTAVAAAATVAVTDHRLAYTAVGPAVNDLRVARHSGVFVVRDLASTLVIGAGCTSVTVHKATCPATGVRAFSAALGPGADRAVVANLLRLPTIIARGGTGDDTLESVVAHVEFRGGPGRDRLFGGIRADVLLAGRGDDVVRGRGGADHLYGGAGDDVMIAGPGRITRSARRVTTRSTDGRALTGYRVGPARTTSSTSPVTTCCSVDGARTTSTHSRSSPTASRDYLNAGAGPDYGCRATPDDTLVGCDEAAK